MIDSTTTNAERSNPLLGIACFCLIGTAVPVFPSDPDAIIDLAHASSGGVAISYSDQNFGTKEANLFLPGRGKDVGSGWETNRSRELGNVDWAVVKLVRLSIGPTEAP